MNPEWLVYVNGQEYGPYTWPQLVQMAASGNVVPQTHVRRNFDSQWYLAEQVPGLFSPAVSTPAPSPKQAVHPTTPPRTAAASGISAKKTAAKSGAHPALATKSGAHPAISAKADPAPAAVAATLPEPAHAMTPQPVPAAVPKGRVVSSKSSTAAADTKPKWIPVNPTAVSPASPAVSFAKSHDDADGAPHSKPDKNKTMVLALGGAILAVAILGGGALVWKLTSKPEKPQEIAAAPVEISETETDPSAIADESNPAGESNPTGVIETTKPATKGTTTPAKTETAKSNPTTTPAVSPATTALLKSIAAWKPIERFGTVGAKGGLTCTKMSAYLAADAAGRKVSVRAQAAPAGEAAPENNTAASVAPNAEENATTPPAIIAPMPAPVGSTKFVSAEAAPFLFVEVTIKNADTKPLIYSGWNNAATAAVLVDAAGKPLELVAPTATPNVTRQISKEVPPGGTVQDTLVFAVPPASDLGFKLVLPRPAFSSKLPGAWGYEISGAALAATAGTQIAGGNPTDPAGAPLVPRSSTTIPIPGLHDPPPPQPAPQPAPQPVPEKPADMPEPEKKPVPMERIPIPGLTDEPETKPAGPKKPEEVPNLAPPPKK